MVFSSSHTRKIINVYNDDEFLQYPLIGLCVLDGDFNYQRFEKRLINDIKVKSLLITGGELKKNNITKTREK